MDKRTLPPDLIWNEYVWRFPDEMRRKTDRACWIRMLETDPNNGAAAKYLAVVTSGMSYDVPADEFWHLWEKTATLLPNEVDICYLAFENSSFDILLDEGVVALGKTLCAVSRR